MKIENVSPVKKIEKKDIRKNSKDFALKLEPEISTNSSPIISNISELFSIYAIEENLKNQKEEAKNYGSELIDALEKLKLSLLMGKYSRTELILINKILENRGHYQDFLLNDIIDEIELRIKVELAKIC